VFAALGVRSVDRLERGADRLGTAYRGMGPSGDVRRLFGDLGHGLVEQSGILPNYLRF